MFWKQLFSIIALWYFNVFCVQGEDTSKRAGDYVHTNSPLASFTLADQFGVSQTVSLPRTNLLIVTIADSKSSEEVHDWVKPIRHTYDEKVTITGIADVSMVPPSFQAMVRRGFQKKYQYPVLLDWKGEVMKSLAYQKGQPNIVLIDRNGIVSARFYGKASEESQKKLFKEIDQLLKGT